MRTPNPRNWSGVDPTKPLTNAATPPAGVDLLCQADQYVLDVATVPYVACGRLFDGCTQAARLNRYLAFVVAPAALHARGAFARSEVKMGWGSDTGHDNLSWTATGGTAGADIVTTVNPLDTVDTSFAGVGTLWGFSTNQLSITVTGETVDDTPTASVDRQYELAQHAYPYVETAMFQRCGSLTIWVSQQVPDLEAL